MSLLKIPHSSIPLNITKWRCQFSSQFSLLLSLVASLKKFKNTILLAWLEPWRSRTIHRVRLSLTGQLVGNLSSSAFREDLNL